MYNEVGMGTTTAVKFEPITAGLSSRMEASPFIARVARSATAAALVASAISAWVPATMGAPVAATETIQHYQSAAKVRAALDQVELFAKLTELKAYRSGWAGPGSLAMTPTGYKVALDFVEFLTQIGGTTKPKLSLSSDGEVNFYWKNAAGVFDFGINRRGRSSFYARLSSGEEFMRDAKPGDVTIPRLLAETVMGA